MPEDYSRRFSGMDRLWGPGASDRLQQAHVVIVGLGGVGSWTAEALARSGVGRLTLIDFDQIAESNVNRQIHALSETLGLAKVEALRQRIRSIHPGCEIQIIEEFVSPDNASDLLSTSADVWVDACDQFSAKLAMARLAVTQKKMLITVGAAGGKSAPEQVRINDLMGVTHDPLLARLRRELRRDFSNQTNPFIGIQCVYSQEAIKPDASCGKGDTRQSHDLSCHGYGSFVAVTGTFGMVAASCAIHSVLSPKAKINTL